MVGACPVFQPGGEFLHRVLTMVDCQAQTIGQGGWSALAAPGSAVSLALAGVLTIFVGLFGYRLMYGEVPDARGLVLTAVKIGAVMALATSWPAFRTIVYDVALRGPAELAGSIGRPAALPGSEGGISARLQGVDNLLAELLVLGAGRPPNSDEMVGPTAALTPAQQQQEMQRLQQLQQRPRWNPAEEAKVLGQARTLYLTGAIAAYASVRLIAGLLLALGPLFAIFLLFDATRGLFEGWVRALAGAAFGAVATSIVLGVQLSMMEPWMATVIATRRAMIPTPSVPIELLVMNLVFAIVLIAVLIATARVAYGFRIPQALRLVSNRFADVVRAPAPVPALAGARAEPAAVPAERARAVAIAEAVAASQRREAFAPPPPSARLTPAAPSASSTSRDAPVQSAVPLGQSGPRRTRGRVSGGAIRRDRRS
ncbi:MAG: type secretion system protein VirB6 [Sphingomonadales bacterium]|jgi:type IV secretion system protein VirB6|nr:type secretion system protein VirB6 [Sphingomonadales bacterium]